MTNTFAGARSGRPAGRILLLALLALLACWPARAQAQARLQQFSVVNTSTTVPKQLTNTATYCTSFVIEAKASVQGAANVGTIYLGPSAVDGLNAYTIASGAIYAYSDPKGRTIDLSTLYIDVTSANDGVTISYW